jgi:hypothetical protein
MSLQLVPENVHNQHDNENTIYYFSITKRFFMQSVRKTETPLTLIKMDSLLLVLFVKGKGLI